MSCEHAETTTLLWLYGEAPEAHAEHVASCAECTEVSALHVDVMSVAEVRQELPERASGVGGRWMAVVSVAAVAAALLVAFLPGPTQPLDTVAVAPAPALDWTEPLSEFGAELDSLDAELDDLSLDIASL